MFSVGDVILMLSDRVEADGKPYRKPKYHVCVCVRERIYFFVNSKGVFADSFRITHAEFSALPNRVSYIGCGTPLRIPDGEFRRRQHRVVGRLPDDVLVRLIDHVNDAKALTEEEKDLIVDALAEAAGYD